MRLLKAVMELIYPQRCLHCGGDGVDGCRQLCEECFKTLVFLHSDERCRRCFTLHEGGTCPRCQELPLPLCGAAATLAYQGAAVALVKGLKYGSMHYLAEGMGAFMARQLLTLKWPWPDYLVPVPLSCAHQLSRGFNQCDLLAKSMSAILKIPVCKALGRLSGDYSQAGLQQRQRQALSAERFLLIDKMPLHGKNLLIIDDVTTSGRTFACCATVLARSHPASLYALAFCKTEE